MYNQNREFFVALEGVRLWCYNKASATINEIEKIALEEVLWNIYQVTYQGKLFKDVPVFCKRVIYYVVEFELKNIDIGHIIALAEFEVEKIKARE